MTTDPVPVKRSGESDRLNDFLRQVVAAFRDEERSDAELLQRFAIDGDQEAFRALVGRHGRSVWAACLARLNDMNDAEDAFQAAFLALARRAGTVDARRGIGAWVRSAARTAARRIRRGEFRLHRLRARVAADAPATTSSEPLSDESQTWRLAAEELERLPQRLRDAVVMYHLEGKTLAQIAESLGWSIATAHRCVSRGLERLRTRLSARGVALTAGVLAAIPAGLVVNTATAASQALRGLSSPSPRVAALIDAILAPRFPSWLVVIGTTLLLATGTAVALVAYPESPPEQADISAKSNPKPDVPADSNITKLAKENDRSTAALAGRVTDTQGKPVAGASVSALVRRPWAPGDRGLRDDVVAKVTTDAAGRYAMTVPADFATHYTERSVTLLVSGVGLPTTTKLVRLGAGGADIGVPSTRTVSGVCVGLDGKPVSGVKLGVVRLGSAAVESVQGREQKLPDGWPADVVSGKGGIFTIAGLPAGEDAWIEVRDDRFALTTMRFPASESKVVRIALAAPRVIEGRVMASDTGKPMVGARVSVFAGPWDSHHDRYTAVMSTADAASAAQAVEVDALCGSDGTFKLRLPSHGPYRVCFHPPEDSAYFGLVRSIEWNRKQATHNLSVTLPAGKLIRGFMKDDTGQPVAGGWVVYRARPNNEHAPVDMLEDRDGAVRTAKDGSFAIAVPPGLGTLSGWGPDPNFLPENYKATFRPNPGEDPSRIYRHARAGITVDANRPPEQPPRQVELIVKRGEVATGRAVGTDGEPVQSGVLICRSVVQSMRPVTTLPLPIRDGKLELPGCSVDRVYPVLLFDSVKGTSVVGEMNTKSTAAMKLQACGTVEVRLVDPSGQPVSKTPVSVAIRLGWDRPESTPPEGERSVPVIQEWFDPAASNLVTGADGRVSVRNVVPGIDYVLKFELRGRSYTTTPFRVSPGQSMTLPDVVAGKVTEKAKPLADVGPEEE